MTKFIAELQTTLFVLGHRFDRRDDKGQTTAEYVGILAFVALLAVAVIAFSDPIANTAKGIIDSAFAKISEALG